MSLRYPTADDRAVLIDTARRARAEGWDVWELPEVIASAARKLDVRITQDTRRALAWAAIYE